MAFCDPRRQLVLEIYVSDMRRSIAFYTTLGFTVERDSGDFVVLSCDDHQLFLAHLPGTELRGGPQGNVRLIVPDVDRCWALADELGASIVSEIADRSYGLRDFTVTDPDGFNLRFASWLDAHERGSAAR
jgi:catechol 2,3-dioxygenase-like lactoylglutathione lyase family enzyme